MFLHISNKSEQDLLSWSTGHYCGRYAYVAPVLAREWDHVKKADHMRITRTARLYVYTQALKDSEETMNSKSRLIHCAVLFVS